MRYLSTEEDSEILSGGNDNANTTTTNDNNSNANNYAGQLEDSLEGGNSAWPHTSAGKFLKQQQQRPSSRNSKEQQQQQQSPSQEVDWRAIRQVQRISGCNCPISFEAFDTLRAHLQQFHMLRCHWGGCQLQFMTKDELMSHVGLHVSQMDDSDFSMTAAMVVREAAMRGNNGEANNANGNNNANNNGNGHPLLQQQQQQHHGMNHHATSIGYGDEEDDEDDIEEEEEEDEDDDPIMPDPDHVIYPEMLLSGNGLLSDNGILNGNGSEHKAKTKGGLMSAQMAKQMMPRNNMMKKRPLDGNALMGNNKK